MQFRDKFYKNYTFNNIRPLIKYVPENNKLKIL